MTTTTAQTDLAATLERYLQMWHETDAAKRAELVRAVFTEDGRHVDPNADAVGHAGLDAMVADIQDRFPGHSIRQTSGVDTHNDQIRFAWELVDADGTTILAGVDVGEVADDGRLRRIAGFWGDLPAA